MTNAADPVETGLVASLARPGGNITGLVTFSPELSGKRLELLKEALPKVSRIAVLTNPANPEQEARVEETKAAAQELKVRFKQLYLVEKCLPLHITIGRVRIRAVAHRCNA
jgi:putative ABC transport system substrate-binding protein